MRSLGAALAVLLLLAPPALAGDADDVPRLVIDTDMGIDDVVALGLALQHARVRVSAIVACEGVLTLEKCVALRTAKSRTRGFSLFPSRCSRASELHGSLAPSSTNTG